MKVISSYLIVIILLFLCCDLTAQRLKVKTYYKNGMKESKGSVHSYSIFYDVKSLSKKFSYYGEIKKKEKEWKYWYPNGQVSRIENYKFIRDKNPEDLPDGKWEYFNAQGVKYLEEYYKEGILVNSEKEIYIDSQPAGKITLHNGIIDTILKEPETVGNNLVINPGFDYFYYKPVPVVYDGRSKIEDWVPFWKAPGNYTPDYLSDIRTIDVLSSYYLLDFPLPEKFSYAGLGLYKDSVSYSEYIEGELTKPLTRGKLYCLKVSVALSSYSGYSVNRLAFYFSHESVPVNDINESSYFPQVVLPTRNVNSDQFITLCGWFVAEGGEQFITSGRFCTKEMQKAIQKKYIKKTQFGIENSAYYLVDNIDLHEITDTTECYCNTRIFDQDFIDIPLVEMQPLVETDLNKLKSGKQIVLKNLNFAFDSYRLDDNADSTLHVLLRFLNTDKEIYLLISGHTDDRGTEEYNQELSVNRAKSVYTWLITNGIDSARLNFNGFGKRQPLYNGAEERQRAQNRRVVVQIKKRY
jgi:OmpA-OmpF porin, OOP family